MALADTYYGVAAVGANPGMPGAPAPQVAGLARQAPVAASAGGVDTSSLGVPALLAFVALSLLLLHVISEV